VVDVEHVHRATPQADTGLHGPAPAGAVPAASRPEAGHQPAVRPGPAASLHELPAAACGRERRLV